MEEHICQEILDSIKECLWNKQPSTLLEAEQRWRLANAHRPDPQAEFAAMHHTTYEQFATRQWDSCKEALALTRYAHQHALVAVAILEEKMEWMSHSLSTGTQATTSTWEVTNARDPSPQDNKGKIPRWQHALGMPIPLAWKRGLYPLWREAPSPSDDSPERDARMDKSAPDAPASLGNWGCDGQQFWLVEGKRRGIRVTPTTEAPPPGGLEWGDISGQFRSGRQPPTIFNVWWPPNLPPWKMAWWWELWEVTGHNNHQEFAWKVWALFKLPKYKVMWRGGQWPLCTTNPLIPWEIQVYGTSRPTVWQLRLPACAVTEDHHLNKDPSVLGGEGPTTGPWWALLFGGQCVEGLAGNGAAGLLYGWRSSQGCSALQLGGYQFTQTGRPQLCKSAAIAEATRPIPGGPFSSTWWEMTSTTNNYHHPDNLTNHSDLGGGAVTGSPQPLHWVCRHCVMPAGGQPVISHHLDPSRRGWPTQLVQDCGTDVNRDLTDPTPCHRGGDPNLISCTLSIVDLGLGAAVGDCQAIASEELLTAKIELSPKEVCHLLTHQLVVYLYHSNVFAMMFSYLTVLSKNLVNELKFYRLCLRQLFYSRGLSTRRENSHWF